MTTKKMIVETTTGDTTILMSEVVAMTKTETYGIVDIHMRSGTIFTARMCKEVEAWLEE
jgi:hypothetical protein